MLHKSGDMLIAFKAIGLSSGLTEADRHVAIIILDHYNHRTGQCDPSYGTLADIVGVTRRTVIRAANKLVARDFFKKTRHGGNFHRNFYEPNWTLFRQLDAEWMQRRRQQRDLRHAKKMSPSRCAASHLAGDTAGVTQTYTSNQSSFETCQRDSRAKDGAAASASNPKDADANLAIAKSSQGLARSFHVKRGTSATAARDSAHRRWNEAITRRLCNNETLHARVIAAIDQQLAEAATDAELKRRGAGIERIVDELQARNIALPTTEREGPA